MDNIDEMPVNHGEISVLMTNYHQAMSQNRTNLLVGNMSSSL